MLARYGQKAVKEYKKAVNNTSIDSINKLKANTPQRSGGRGGLITKWSWKFKDELISGIINNSPYINMVNDGWSRTRPIYPIPPKKFLMFEVGKRRSAVSSRSTLFNRYKAASDSMKGKGLKGLARMKAITAKSGVVMTKKVTKPAHFKGYHFIEKTIPVIEKRLLTEIARANERIFAA